jgi:hypothetical protein
VSESGMTSKQFDRAIRLLKKVVTDYAAMHLAQAVEEYVPEIKRLARKAAHGEVIRRPEKRERPQNIESTSYPRYVRDGSDSVERRRNRTFNRRMWQRAYDRRLDLVFPDDALRVFREDQDLRGDPASPGAGRGPTER